MKPSSTSHSETTFGGILQPIVEVLERNKREKGRLIGQDIVIPRNDIRAIIALDAENDIHLLISPATGDDARFSQFELRGLSVADREWSVAGSPVERYLDVSCSTGTSPSFKRPFLRFAEDVLYEISQPGTNPSDAAYRTCVRWRRFWSTDITTAITTEWLYGISGELTFLLDILERFGPNVVRSWAGPLAADHDFQVGNELAVEVKTSASMPFRIHCNVRQLDPMIFKRLFLACYHVSPSPSGKALPELVRQIEDLLSIDENLLDEFHKRLSAAGYSRQLEQNYSEMPTKISAASLYRVDDLFPKIVERSFIAAPDHRITDIRYTLQIAGLDESSVETLASELVDFSKA